MKKSAAFQILLGLLLMLLVVVASLVVYQARMGAASNREATRIYPTCTHCGLTAPDTTPCEECELTATRLSAQMTARPTQDGDGVVRAAMFWKAGCGHCEEAINVILPPIRDRYGERFDLLMIEVVTMDDVNVLFQVADAYGIDRQSVGVPFLVIGDHALVGTLQIEDQLPGLIDAGLARGGLGLPPVAVLTDILAARDIATATPGPPAATTTAAATEAAVTPPAPTPAARPEGFTLARVVLALLAASLVYALAAIVWTRAPVPPEKWTDLLLPILAVAGLGVAGYLSYVEITASGVACGPVGDCNAVQSSSYARLFGTLPIGVLGMIGYVLLLAAWWVRRRASDPLKTYAGLAFYGMAFFGVLFSIYLTYLELYVIEAVCLWCITSAILTALILPLGISPLRAWLQGPDPTGK